MQLVAVQKQMDIPALLAAQAGSAVEATEILCSLVQRRTVIDFLAQVNRPYLAVRDVRRLVRRATRLHDEINGRLSQALVLPADREDLQAVSAAVCSIVRMSAQTVEEVATVGLSDPPPQAIELAQLLARGASLMAPMVRKLEAQDDLLQDYHEVASLRKQARRLGDQLVAEMLCSESVQTILRWQTICRNLERALDSAVQALATAKLAVLETSRWQPR